MSIVHQCGIQDNYLTKTLESDAAIYLKQGPPAACVDEAYEIKPTLPYFVDYVASLFTGGLINEMPAYAETKLPLIKYLLSMAPIEILSELLDQGSVDFKLLDYPFIESVL